MWERKGPPTPILSRCPQAGRSSHKAVGGGGGASGLKGSSVQGQVGVLRGLGGGPQEAEEVWRTTPKPPLKGAPAGHRDAGRLP